MLIGQLGTTGTHVEPSAIGERSFSTHGVTFNYPSTLHHLGPDEVAQIQSTPLPEGFADPADGPWQEYFGLDRQNAIRVFADPLPFVITRDNVDELAASVRSGLTDAGADTAVETLMIGGLPALELQGEVRTPSGGMAHKDSIEVIRGSVGYAVDCQSTADRHDEMADACASIVHSMHVPEHPSFSGWHVLRSEDGATEITVPPRWEIAPKSRRGPDIDAVLSVPGGSLPLAVMVVASGPLPHPMSSATFASGIAKRGGMRSADEGPMRLPWGTADVVTMTGDGERFVLFAVAEGRTGHFVMFLLKSGEANLSLLRPTMDAIVKTLVFEEA